MLKSRVQLQDAIKVLPMPDQVLGARFIDRAAPGLLSRTNPRAMRLVLFGLPLVFFIVVGSVLLLAFQSDGRLTTSEVILIVLMALLSGWEAVPSANVIIGLMVPQKPPQLCADTPLTIAILATIRDENASNVIPGKLKLLRSLQRKSLHRFDLHVVSDSSSQAHIDEERRIVGAAFHVPAFHHKRPVNTDFKSGNIRDWVSRHGAEYDAFIILDADSELDPSTALALANSLAADQACGLIQTVPVVLPGNTRWQRMQSVASRIYGASQGCGLAAWMADEANYYGHNAIVRTKAFAASAGLPHLQGRGFWNGTILSHDFVEAALLRRAGWAVRLLPSTTGSFEQAPSDVIAHLKRDARWCLGNFQHSRVLGAAGLHPMSRFHLLSGIATYLSSALWLATLVLWATLDRTAAGVGGTLAVSAFLLIIVNLLLPRVLGVLHATRHLPSRRWDVAKVAIAETFFSSLFAPSLMLQRVMMIGRVVANRGISWAPHEKTDRSLPDYFVFHAAEVLWGLGLLALVERSFLTLWFLPLALCLAFTPVLSWFAAQPIQLCAHEKLNEATRL